MATAAPARLAEDAVAVAEELATRFGLPHWRFTNSGTESTMAAVRLARALTGHHGTILVFDEVKTGLAIAAGGAVERYRIADGEPLSASVRVRCTTGLGRGDWQTRVETDSHMSSTASEVLVSRRLEAFEGDERVYERTWELRLPRDCV